MGEGAGSDCCEFLPWDSEFFGLRIGRLTVSRITPALWTSVEAWCGENTLDCVYFLADPADDGTVRTAEENRFRMVDIRVTFETVFSGSGPATAGRTGKTPGVQVDCRPCRPEDLDALASLVRTNHRDSRFYHDGNFPPARCDDLYETWLRKSAGGLADAFFIAAISREPVGYITCRRTGDRTGEIGLFGIAAVSRGSGIGGALLDSAFTWAREEGLSGMRVVTQGRNIPAQRFYQRHGFVTADLKVWYHRWFNRP